jgi:hypothetical protein
MLARMAASSSTIAIFGLGAPGVMSDLQRQHGDFAQNVQ